MGVPKLITAPSKSYVAINGYKCDKSITPTLCDLGRVSNIAAAIMLPRSGNFGNRNRFPQSVQSLPHKKRPIAEVLDVKDPKSIPEKVTVATSVETSSIPHKKRRYTHEIQSSSSVQDTISSQRHQESPSFTSQPTTLQSVQLHNEESEGHLLLQSNQHEVSHYSNNDQVPNQSHSKVQRNQQDRLHSKDTNQISNQVHSHLHSNQQDLLHSSAAAQLSDEAYSHLQRLHHNQSQHPNSIQGLNQHSMQSPISVIEQSQAQYLFKIQILQQNQQLRNENAQLQKQLSLFRQLIKNPQRLNQVIGKLGQRVQ